MIQVVGIVEVGKEIGILEAVEAEVEEKIDPERVGTLQKKETLLGLNQRKQKERRSGIKYLL